MCWRHNGNIVTSKSGKSTFFTIDPATKRGVNETAKEVVTSREAGEEMAVSRVVVIMTVGWVGNAAK